LRRAGPVIAYAWIGILTVTTYSLAGHMREQVCLYMCPWPRIQAALTDEYALNVTYRYDRGSRAVRSRRPSSCARKASRRATASIVCNASMFVRQGSISAGRQSRLHPVRPVHRLPAMHHEQARAADRLIAYDTDLNIKQRTRGKTLLSSSCACAQSLYAGIIAVVGGIMLYTLATRDSEGISVIHDRNPMYVRLSDGALRNGYTIRIVNKQLKYRDFIVSVTDCRRRSLISSACRRVPTAGSSSLSAPIKPRKCALVVTDYSATPPPASTSILFKLIDIDSGETAEMRDHFFGPGEDLKMRLHTCHAN
jgi:polyferredoxin